ncbi:MAG: ABC transporter ATP-binding protein [Acidimicrobiales bacterium]
MNAERKLTASTEGEPLLVVDNLRTQFFTPRGTVTAVDGVSFTLERGTTLGVVGESGSGKTVLSRSIMNLLPSRNVKRTGSVKFAGKEILNLSDKDMRHVWGKDLAMVFQDPMTSLNPVMKVGKQITESLLLHLDVSKEEARDTAISLLRSVKIPEPEKRFDEYPHQLSGGMRQRVMIAVALACGPRLLFADEPTTALDVTVQSQILNLLQEQQLERHMAMILVTHDLGVVAGRADRIAVMYGGRLVETAPTTTLFDEMRHPYTEALMRAIPRLEHQSHQRLQAIGGRPPDLVDPPKGCAFAPRCPRVQERCLHERPELRLGAEGHQYACHFPVGTPEGDEALEKNLSAGLPQAVEAMAGVPVSIDAG